jgi:hypothetical protein
MRVFIGGVMQGSRQDNEINNQNYRQIIRQAILEKHTHADVVDPFSLFPDSVGYGDERAKQVLLAMADEAGQSDLVISYLPEASMGTALEMIRAYDNGKPVITISPMAENWVIRSLSQRVFSTMETFLDWLQQEGLDSILDG